MAGTKTHSAWVIRGAGGSRIVLMGLLLALASGCATVKVAQKSKLPAPPAREQGSPGARFAQEVLRSEPAIVECSSLQCLRDGLAACRASHFYSGSYSAEGTPVYEDVFVLRGTGGRCWVVSYVDFTQDYWGGCSVRKRVCPTVDALLDAASESPKRDGCGHNEVLLRLNPCKNPYGDEGAESSQTGSPGSRHPDRRHPDRE